MLAWLAVAGELARGPVGIVTLWILGVVLAIICLALRTSSTNADPSAPPPRAPPAPDERATGRRRFRSRLHDRNACAGGGR